MKALLRSALTCAIMIVSDRDPSGSSIAAAASSRESEPSTRKFIGLVAASGTATGLGTSPRMSSRATLSS